MIIIPIGINCDIATVVKQLNLRNVAFPFDWNVTFQGVSHIIENDFNSFLEMDHNKLNANYNLLFHHDEFPKDIAKYKRRIERLKKILQGTEKILFIRMGHEIHDCYKCKCDRKETLDLNDVLQKKYPTLNYNIITILGCSNCYVSEQEYVSVVDNIKFYNIVNNEDMSMETKFKKLKIIIKNLTTNIESIQCKKFKIKLLYEYGNELAYITWGNMLKNYKKNNIKLAHWSDNNENNDIDFYIVIQYPQNASDFYIEEKTILIQDEANINGIISTGISKNFYYWHDIIYKNTKNNLIEILCHKNYLNNVRWLLNNIPTKFPEKRLDKVCTIISFKYNDPGQKLRVNFIKFLEQKYPNIIDIYGSDNAHSFINYRGKVPTLSDNYNSNVNYILNGEKEHLLSQYKYYFMCENNNINNYATEKIWESILCENLCFYWGCPNLDNYIDKNSYFRLQLHDFNKDSDLIYESINNNIHTEKLNTIKCMKEKILNEMCFWETINKLITK